MQKNCDRRVTGRDLRKFVPCPRGPARNKHPVFSCALALCLGCLLLGSSAWAREGPPNIVFILADDVGWGDLGSYGHPYAKTPSLDRLASEGTRFEQFYVTGNVCAPSRTGFMTGKHPLQFPHRGPAGGFGNQVTITELLHRRGYRVGHFGKWGIGQDEEAKSGVYGIDQVEVIGASRDRAGGRDEMTFDAAIRFIEENRNVPFYVNVWGRISHHPVIVRPEQMEPFEGIRIDRQAFGKWMQEKFDQCESNGGDIDTAMRKYLTEIYLLDAQVGRLLQTLERLGLAENTIVVFSSDNGPALLEPGSVASPRFSEYEKRPGLNMLGYAGGLRAGKHENYEGGIRVPFIVRWPGHIPAGRVDSESVLSALDWLPTLSNAAGVGVRDTDFDGENVLDIWRGTSRPRLTPLFWSYVSGDPPAMREGQWKLHLFAGGRVELYDLLADREERNDLADQFPEIVARMKQQMNALRSSYLEGRSGAETSPD